MLSNPALCCFTISMIGSDIGGLAIGYHRQNALQLGGLQAHKRQHRCRSTKWIAGRFAEPQYPHHDRPTLRPMRDACQLRRVVGSRGLGGVEALLERRSNATNLFPSDDREQQLVSEQPRAITT